MGGVPVDRARRVNEMMEPTAALIGGVAQVLQVDAATISPDTVLEGLGWDSVAVLSTIAFIDEHYGITVSGEELSRCATIRDISGLIARS